MENNLDRDEKTKNHYELMRNLEMDVSYFHCYWEDSQGIFTEDELKEFFEEVGQGYEFDQNSTQENSDCIGWGVYGYHPHFTEYFDNLKNVIDFLNEEQNISLYGVCDNMTIRRVL